jgi:hypothetical protein
MIDKLEIFVGGDIDLLRERSILTWKYRYDVIQDQLDWDDGTK